MNVSVAFDPSVIADLPDAQVRFVVTDAVPYEAALYLLDTIQRIGENFGVSVAAFDRRYFKGAVRVDRLASGGSLSLGSAHLEHPTLFRYSSEGVAREMLPQYQLQTGRLTESIVFVIERSNANAVPTDEMASTQDMLAAEIERWGSMPTCCVIDAETPMTNLRAGEPGLFT